MQTILFGAESRQFRFLSDHIIAASIEKNIFLTFEHN